ncbi:MAG: noncanonical pyrimidine nucleotidase, YjjG family, partial [Duncaniella sp.]|nr:noncanonical pyrimidine nucleotidase, YjjG family [Duncaniella sp.]
MKYKWIWFDLDDTLIDFHANSRMALRIIYDECRLDRFFNSPDEWAGTYESHNLTLWARYSRAEITQEFLRIDRFAT